MSRVRSDLVTRQGTATTDNYSGTPPIHTELQRAASSALETTKAKCALSEKTRHLIISTAHVLCRDRWTVIAPALYTRWPLSTAALNVRLAAAATQLGPNFRLSRCPHKRPSSLRIQPVPLQNFQPASAPQKAHQPAGTSLASFQWTLPAIV